MTNKKIAAAVLSAQKMHRESWVVFPEPAIIKGEYSISFEECFVSACEIAGLDDGFWRILLLAYFHDEDWPTYNLQAWSEQVVQGRPFDEITNRNEGSVKDQLSIKPMTSNTTDTITLCCNCKYRKASWIYEWVCKKTANIEINYVTGRSTTKYMSCNILNSDGKCGRFEKSTTIREDLIKAYTRIKQRITNVVSNFVARRES